MKKVLFICYHFPPILVGWRFARLVRYLPKFGWQPIVISAAESVSYAKDYSLLKQVPKDTQVYRVGHREPSVEWEYVRRKFRINYVFPDYYKSWYSPALREARNILQREKVDLIFSSSPPYTSAFVAMKLKKEFNIPWVAEWRDLWSGNEFLNQSYERTIIKPLRSIQRSCIKKGERELFMKSDKTIVVAPHHRKQLSELQGVRAGDVEIITNGYDESNFKELKAYALYPNNLTITFLGSFYPQFREHILSFLETINELDKEAEVIFIGQGAAEMQGVDMPNLTKILHMSKEKALAFAAGSDFLFLVMPPSAKWIPGKIFEYLRLGKPVLALVPQDGDVATIIQESKAGFILSHERGELKEQLLDIFDQWRGGKFKGFHPDWEYVAQFERRNLTRRLVDVFNKAILK